MDGLIRNRKLMSVLLVAAVVGGIFFYLFVLNIPEFKGNIPTGNSSAPSVLDDTKESSNFKIYRKVDFDSHSIGNYKQDQFSSDWSTGEKLYQPNTTRIDTMGTNNKVLANFYPEGTFGRGGGLNQFGNLDGEKIEEVYLSYRIMFEEEWEWGLSGKLPGFIYGKVGTVASGGDGPHIGDKGSSVRLIWNNEGKLNFYVYHHEMQEKYGENFGNEFFGPVQPGVWHTITMRLVSNEIGEKNGLCQVWLDGELRASITGLKLRTQSSPKFVEAITLSTFMGGADDRFASPKNQTMYLDDFYVWGYTAQFVNSDSTLVGNQLIDASHTLLTPLDKLVN